MEKFVDKYVSCKCCGLKLHIYMFQLNRKTNIRSTSFCISCNRDCRGKAAGCQLGTLHEV